MSKADREDQTDRHSEPFDEILDFLKNEGVDSAIYLGVRKICEEHQKNFIEMLSPLGALSMDSRFGYDHTPRSAVLEMQEIQTARAECANYLDGAPLAFDSAADVYGHALKNMGMSAAEIRGNRPSAMAGIFRAMRQAQSGNRALAMDSAGGKSAMNKFMARFPDAAIPRVA